MSKTIKVALAGAGAFGIKHLDGIKNIDGVEVVSLVSRELEKTREVATKYGIRHVTTDLADSLALQEVDAVILCTPTQMHAAQSIACLKAGKHVQVEIPLADTLRGAEEVAALVLLLDEPASGLNHEEVATLGALIREVRDRLGVTVLLVEHHMSLVMSVSDKVVALNFGRKIAEGTPAAVQAHPDVIQAYLGVAA